MKKQPVKPKRDIVVYTASIDDGDNLMTLIRLLEARAGHKIDINDIIIDATYLQYSELEGDASYNKKLAAYQKKLDAYKAWYKENKGAIDEEVKRRINVSSKRKQSQRAKEIAALKKRLEKLES